MNSLVTTVYALDEDEKTLGIHSKCHMLFAPEEEEPEKSFTDLLDSFFTTHNTIKENLKQLGNGMPDMEKKERVRIKGFAAYKDNSTELKGEWLPISLRQKNLTDQCRYDTFARMPVTIRVMCFGHTPV